MNRSTCILLFILLGLASATVAQQPVLPGEPARPATARGKNYPSLLWRITGKGMKKPSYLFGTMHVSDKLAFHLGDSFYNAIRNAEVVALETNPETWQEDYSRSTLFNPARNSGRKNAYTPSTINMVKGAPDDKMYTSSFAIDSYEELVKAALSMEPSMVNNLLYRTYGETSDFEEDTFLDMYIFQVGRKLGKKVSGVESFVESERLLVEAYRDMRKEQKNRRRYYYDIEQQVYNNPRLIEDAYRKGDLDLLDSLETINMRSESFREKFLYRRNEIQAASMDSIMRRSSLFVGVGAAHLPGPRGVIALLRQMGYTVRPVFMDNRNSSQKESIERLRVDHIFQSQTAADGLYKVAIPGNKFYHFTDWSGMQVVQYADMVNGTYYLVTRIKTNSSLWGHSNAALLDKIDHWLYEYIPGKIRKKTPITRNGYPGLDILAQTRRGDYQQYQVFVTPFEVVVFKMSGVGNYITRSPDAGRFFGSVRLKEYGSPDWVSWQPPTGGFSIQLPHTPAFLRDNNTGKDRLEYAAVDKKEGTSFLVMKASLHQYSQLETDSFLLNLMEESYASTEYIDRALSRRFLLVQGLPALEVVYKHTDSALTKVRFMVRGAAYFVLVARYSRENPGIDRFFNSFALIPYQYPAAQELSHPGMGFSVRSSVRLEVPEAEQPLIAGLSIPEYMSFEEDPEKKEDPRFETLTVSQDTTGESIFVVHSSLSRYTYKKDSADWWNKMFERDINADSAFVLRSREFSTLDNGYNVQDIQVSDTGSSRLLRFRMLHKGSRFFLLSTLADTVTRYSSFVNDFFSSFRPADTLALYSLFQSKSAMVLEELLSRDTLIARRAIKEFGTVPFDAADAPLLIAALDTLHWKKLNYLTLKNKLVRALGRLDHPVVVPYLKQLYWKAGDTVFLQDLVLSSMLSQRTRAAYQAYKEIMLQEPPIVLDQPYPGYYSVGALDHVDGPVVNYEDESPALDRLHDSLALTRTLFPDLLQLCNLDDYKVPVLDLLSKMVDSGYLKGKDYESYFLKLFLEGRQLLKKQRAEEARRKLQEAGRKDLAMLYANDKEVEDEEEEELESGNKLLDQYAVLLLPFREKQPGVQQFFQQLMETGDRKLLFNNMGLLLRNGVPVADTLLQSFAADDKYRSKLYAYLKKGGLLQHFPAAYRNQEAMARAYLVAGEYRKPDSLAFLEKLPAGSGLYYFFKYKPARDEDNWYIANAGLLPADKDSLDLVEEEFTGMGSVKLKSDKPVSEQLQQLLKEMMYSRHPIASNFFDTRYMEWSKEYLPEIVKARRFRD
ncbi:MAG: TraB/GumN family protein [Candidatus Pseudobacter hemicellulosilyticus]|uniref:TraB/GumN family protein n=1 Tax=Candidatus Pseudobacter hemicellulosilyticus TaxID=3121375 RepID=A0AAJ5WS11_9BACT|nr:MAG: TraB/GumN family protein [Pseudobacter sp.]